MGRWRPLLAFVLLSAWTTSTSGQAALEDIVECYNSKAEAAQSGASFASFLREEPPRLLIHKVWHSSRLPSLQLTVITAATVSRLAALELQCSSWAGPLVAAVYLPLPNSSSSGSSGSGSDSNDMHGDRLSPQHLQVLQEASNAIQQLFDRSEAAAAPSSGCQLDVLLLLERTLDPAVHALLPINALRNAALAAASTQLVALVDVDLLLSRELAVELGDPDRYQALREGCRNRQAWILPAFETPKRMGLEEGQGLVEASVRGSKVGLVEKVAAGKLQPFASVIYPRGHSCTNFKHWYSSPQQYSVQYTVNCEPWFVIDRRACPQYDARFRGYGWNKVQQVALVNASGFSFWVHPSAFLLHRPHPRSEAQDLYAAATSGKGPSPPPRDPNPGSGAAGSGAAGSGAGFGGPEGRSVSKAFHRKVAAMRHTALRDMMRGVYRVVVDEGSRACRERLGWWQAPGGQGRRQAA